MLLASALPVSNTVLSLVMWSLAEVPVSLVIVVLITGAAGAAVSMVTLRADDAALTLPAVSVAFAVRLWAPSSSAAVV